MKEYINVEKDLITASNIDLSKNSLLDLAKLYQYKQHDIKENEIHFYLEDEGELLNVNYWKSRVNEFIDIFKSNVEKNDMSNVKKEDIELCYDLYDVFDDDYDL